MYAPTAIGNVRNSNSRRNRRRYGDSDHRCGWRGEHLFRDAVRISVDRFDTQRQAVDERERAEVHAARAFKREIAARQQNDVVKHAGTRREFGLPHVADRAGDRPGRIASHSRYRDR